MRSILLGKSSILELWPGSSNRLMCRLSLISDFQHAMCEFLKKVYTLCNNTRRYQLEFESSNFCRSHVPFKNTIRVFYDLWVEYHAMLATCSEIVWLRGLLAELGIFQSKSTPLHDDNTSVIQIAANFVYHKLAKHIEVDCHYIRDVYDSKVVALFHVSTAQ